MVTGRIYANGYWDGLDAIFLKDDVNNAGWVYVLAMELPDPDMSVDHAILGRVACCHARTVETAPSESEIANIQAFVYVSNN
tara:strand:+ start:172 stop:417 length:246 start_codon:yes stop_codon:yes gene_type:complete